jgi:hypothetical protein
MVMLDAVREDEPPPNSEGRRDTNQHRKQPIWQPDE